MVWTKFKWCEQNFQECDQHLHGVNKIMTVWSWKLMVWTQLFQCDFENRWCEQNLDGVNKIFKSVINIFMVWTKLWRCDLENWWCEQIFFGVIKCWWCDKTIFRCEQTSIFWKLCDHTIWCDVFTCFFLMCWQGKSFFENTFLHKRELITNIFSNGLLQKNFLSASIHDEVGVSQPTQRI